MRANTTHTPGAYKTITHTHTHARTHAHTHGVLSLPPVIAAVIPRDSLAY